MGIQVRVTMNDAARRFPELANRHRQIARDAINRTATQAERAATEKVAKDLKLPLRFIRNRLDLAGQIKGRRTSIRRATVNNLNTELSVYVRGLPVGQVAGVQLRRKGGGVKGKGGRFYQGAFKSGQKVFKRIGRERTPLMVPKIGLRERLTKEFNRHITGPEGAATFRRFYDDGIRRNLARYGVRT